VSRSTYAIASAAERLRQVRSCLRMRFNSLGRKTSASRTNACEVAVSINCRAQDAGSLLTRSAGCQGNRAGRADHGTWDRGLKRSIFLGNAERYAELVIVKVGRVI
jgi:hypothetical protein